jgi:hypothetical protein
VLVVVFIIRQRASGINRDCQGLAPVRLRATLQLNPAHPHPPLAAGLLWRSLLFRCDSPRPFANGLPGE